MEIIYLILLFILWACFWSFSSVLTYRVKNNIEGSLFGRSKCPSCNHQLKWYNLIPIFSYLFQRWKCSYCKKSISKKYLYLELFFWIIFLLFWFFVDLNYNYISLLSFIVILFWITLLSVYDFLYKEVEDIFTLPLVLFIISILLLQDFSSINYISLYSISEEYFNSNLISTSLSLISILLVYKAIFSEKYHWLYVFISLWIIGYLFLSSYLDYLTFWAIWAVLFFVFFYVQILLTKWKWLGGWDLRFAIILWLLYWVSIFSWIFTTYVIAILFSLWVIIYKKKMKGIEIPFGPILFLTYFILLLIYR